MKNVYLKGISTGTSDDPVTALQVTIERPAAVVSGDLLMARIKCAPSVQITAAKGWSFVNDEMLEGDRVSCYGRTATAVEPVRYSWGFTPKECGVTIEMRVFGGVHAPWYSRLQTLLRIKEKQAIGGQRNTQRS